MNRAERRRSQQAGMKKEPVYMMTKNQIDTLVREEVDRRFRELMPDITDTALVQMIYNSVLVIEGHFGELREMDQITDVVRAYVDLLEFQLECFAERMVTGADMRKYLKDVYDIDVDLK